MRPTRRNTILTVVLSGLVGAVIAVPLSVYGSHGFNDVDSSQTFHADIDWLADAGVTRGCNPPANTEFCPEDPVTRAQMAAFMRRFAQYLDAEDGSPAMADNAERLQGKTVAELAPRAAFNAIDNAANGQNLTLPVEVTAPAPGVLIAGGGVDTWNLASFVAYHCMLTVDGDRIPGTRRGTDLDGHQVANHGEDCTTSGAAAVDAGTYDVAFETTEINSDTILEGASVWVLWVPFDATGAVPDAFTTLGDFGDTFESSDRTDS